MAMPDYTHFMLPVLRGMQISGNIATRKDLYRLIGRNEVPGIQLTEANLRESVPSGSSRVKNRIGWAIDGLLRCGFIHRTERSTYQITESGLHTLERYATDLPDEVRKSWGKTKISTPLSHDEDQQSDSTDYSTPLPDGASPEDLLEEVLGRLNQDLQGELHELVMALDDVAFERLVLVVLHSLGYGDGETPVEPTQRSNDGGIDGIISLDRLGVQKVYVQAKRWAGTVGRPQLQQFVGALGPHRSGVFITTSGYSRDALEYAGQYDGRLVLIDGLQFVKLMIDAGVGVQTQKRIDLLKVDRDFFEDF